MQSIKVQQQQVSHMLLISPVGLAHGWLPLGAALIKSYVEKRSSSRVHTLSLCVTFSEYLRQNHPELAAFDRTMGEWGSSFHDVYLAAKYFHHMAPEHALAEVVSDMCERKDIFQISPWDIRHPIPEEMRQQQLDLFITYCELAEEFSMRAVDNAFVDPPFLIGFSCTAQQLFSAVTLAKYIKGRYPDTPIIIGGPVITSRNAQSYVDTFPEIDATILGDGEQPVLAIVEQLSQGKSFPVLPNMFTRAGQRLFPMAPTYSHSLDEIDAPDFDELSEIIAGGLYPLSTWMARGCSWGKCKFCSIPQFQRSFIHRSAHKIYHDLLFLSERYGMNRFRFGDWEVNGDRKTIEELCTLLIDGKQDFEFWGEVNARKMTFSMMMAMKKAGFVSVQVGLEGLSDSLLQKMKKPTTVLENVKCLIYAHECGLDLFSNLLYNFPGEQESEIAETLEVIRAIRHLIKPPVTLALTELLLETDADIIHDLPPMNYERYAFEQRCFPAQRQNDALLFLMKHTSPVRGGWNEVQREIQQCYTKTFTFEHRFLDDTVMLFDDRSGEKLVTTLSGLDAKIYRALAGNVLSFSQLCKLFPDVSSAWLEECIQKFAANAYLLRRGKHLLALSINTLREITLDDTHTSTIIPASL